ncbi:MAG: hypothetical protein ACKVQA_19330, partial [Burkholderiales bacterium]
YKRILAWAMQLIARVRAVSGAFSAAAKNPSVQAGGSSDLPAAGIPAAAAIDSGSPFQEPEPPRI